MKHLFEKLRKAYESMNPSGRTPPSKTADHPIITNPCVCCGETRHDGIIDEALQGYVCVSCAHCLRVAEGNLMRRGISRVVFTLPDIELRALV